MFTDYIVQMPSLIIYQEAHAFFDTTCDHKKELWCTLWKILSCLSNISFNMGICLQCSYPFEGATQQKVNKLAEQHVPSNMVHPQ